MFNLSCYPAVVLATCYSTSGYTGHWQAVDAELRSEAASLSDLEPHSSTEDVLI